MSKQQDPFSPFAYLDSVVLKSEYRMGTDIDISKYNPYIITNALSMSAQTLPFAEWLNENSNIPKKLQYDFLWYGLPKGVKKGFWIKGENSDDVDVVKYAYKVSHSKAIQILSVLSKEQIEELRQKTSKGGKT